MIVEMPAYAGFVALPSDEQRYFVKRVLAAGMAPAEVAEVIEFESAGTWDPAIGSPRGPKRWNKGSLADGRLRGPVGLIQFTRSGGAKAVGRTLEELAAMSFREQLEPVLAYFGAWPLERLNADNNLNDYHAAAWGDNVGGSPGYLLASESVRVPAYTANAQLDQYKPLGELHAWELDKVTRDRIGTDRFLRVDTEAGLTLEEARGQVARACGAWVARGPTAIEYWRRGVKWG